MKLHYDVSNHAQTIRKAIRKYGHAAENNYDHYMHCENEDEQNVLCDYGKDRVLLMQYEPRSNIWSLFPCGILAPEKDRLKLLVNVTKHLLQKKQAKKVTVEVLDNIRKGLLEHARAKNTIQVRTYNYVLQWPIYNMENWDPKLRGKEMKKLRNIRNRFYKRHTVRVVDAKKVAKEKLKEICKTWQKKRLMNDEVDEDYYIHIIDQNFKGFAMAKAVYVNGKPAAITGGWRVPNSKTYYSAVGLFDYSYEGLGEIATIDEMNRLKKMKYRYVDFGGSDPVLLRFKKKFKPESIYKTHTFSMVLH